MMEKAMMTENSKEDSDVKEKSVKKASRNGISINGK